MTRIHKPAYICAKYIVDNDLGARKQMEYIKKNCPENVNLENFVEVVSDYTFTLVQEAIMAEG